VQGGRDYSLVHDEVGDVYGGELDSQLLGGPEDQQGPFGYRLGGAFPLAGFLVRKRQSEVMKHVAYCTYSLLQLTNNVSVGMVHAPLQSALVSQCMRGH